MDTYYLSALFEAVGIKAKTVGVTFANSKKIYHYGCVHPNVRVSSHVVVESNFQNRPYSVGEVVSLVDGLRSEVSAWIIQVINKDQHEQFLAQLLRLNAYAMSLDEKMKRGQNAVFLDRLNQWAARNPENWDAVHHFYEESMAFKNNISK